MTDRLRSLVTELRHRAREYSKVGANVSGAQLCEQIATEIENLSERDGNEAFTIRQAAEESGYTEEHLRRLVRDGKIPNAGRPGSPKIRTADLPRKPSPVAGTGPVAYDPVADAQRIRNRRRGGAYGSS